jgi:hypothetical protein
LKNIIEFVTSNRRLHLLRKNQNILGKLSKYVREGTDLTLVV